MEGVRELGNVVCSHIASLQSELRALRKEPIVEPIPNNDEQPGTHNSDPDADKPFKGTLFDRYFRKL